MCAIINANVTSEVFGDDRTPRGQILYEWLTRGKTGRLVVGGKLLRELSGSSTFNQCTLSPMTDSISISSAKTRRRGNFRIHSFLPRATKTSVFLIILSVLAAPVAWSQETDVPSWLMNALRKEDPDTLAYQVVIKGCSRRSGTLGALSRESDAVAKTAGIVERAFQIARIKPKPIASSEVHLKVDIICYQWRAIYVSYVRVAFAFPWLDGTPLAYDWDFNPLSSFGRDIWSDIDSAVDNALRAYVRANFDVGT